jgi:hypothetical protein
MKVTPSNVGNDKEWKMTKALIVIEGGKDELLDTIKRTLTSWWAQSKIKTEGKGQSDIFRTDATL